MKIRLLLVLKEVSEDLEDGKKFYDEREPGIGDYFFNCILSDIESFFIGYSLLDIQNLSIPYSPLIYRNVI